MTRYYYSSKQEADYLHQVNVYFLNKHGYFGIGFHSGIINWSRNGEETGKISIQSTILGRDRSVRFIYTATDRQTGKKTDYDYVIQLSPTPCHFGGERYWFICPFYSHGVYCGKRVGTLYLGDKYFACRHCNDLTWDSRNLGGISKSLGQIISEPDLEEMRKEIKRETYKGKITRKYLRYLKKERKAFFQLQTIVGGLYRNKNG